MFLMVGRYECRHVYRTRAQPEVPARRAAPRVLPRGRQGVRKRTLANLSKWPDDLVRGFRILLKGGVAVKSVDDVFEILRSRPHGHVAAVLEKARRLGLEGLLDRRPSRMRSLALAMIARRVFDPRSKLATARGLNSETQADTLGEETGAEDATAEEFYEAMDWLLLRRIERTLAARRIEDGSLCDREGRPVAAEVLEGNTADPGAVASQVEKLAARFSLSRVVLGRRPGTADRRPHPRRPVSGGAAVDHRAQGSKDPQAGFRRGLADVGLRRTEPGGDLRVRALPRESGSSSAAIRCSRPSVPASVRRCSRPPRRSSTWSYGR